MFSLILKLMALRPLLSMAIFGIPILTLLAVGLFAVVALKVLVFIVLPAIAIFWFVRRQKKG